MTLAEVSLKRPVTAVMFFISLTVIGLLAAFRLPLEFLPDIEAPFLFAVQIIVYTGAIMMLFLFVLGPERGNQGGGGARQDRRHPR